MKVIRVDLKFRAESPGVADSSFGGMESFGPPAGGIIFAQPDPPVMLMTRIENAININNKRCLLIVFGKDANLTALRLAKS